MPASTGEIFAVIISSPRHLIFRVSDFRSTHTESLAQTPRCDSRALRALVEEDFGEDDEEEWEDVDNKAGRPSNSFQGSMFQNL